MSVQPINNLTFNGSTKLNLGKIKTVNPFEKYSRNGDSTFSYINVRKEAIESFKRRNLLEYKIYEFLINHPKIHAILKMLGL